MKKVFTNSIAIIMSTLVFYGGAGINIISYCCNECHSNRVEAIMDDTGSLCLNIEGHKNDNCCDKKHKKQECSGYGACHDMSSEGFCGIERVHFDWTVQNITELNIDISPLVSDLLPTVFFDISHTHSLLVCENNSAMPNGPPLVCPHDYLSILTVLLI